MQLTIDKYTQMVAPLDVRDPSDRAWLQTLVWPEQHERLRGWGQQRRWRRWFRWQRECRGRRR